MAKCSVCKKEIDEGATECSLSCVLKAGAKQHSKAHKAKNSFDNSMQKMMKSEDNSVPSSEVDMIIVKHRWMLNRNVVQGSIVYSFDDNGIARIPNMGNNRAEVEAYVRHTQGLVSFVEDVVKEPEKVSEPQNKEVPSADRKIISEKSVEKKQEKSIVVSEDKKSSVEEVKAPVVEEKPELAVKKPVGKKPEPVKKPVGKKPVGKKSTKKTYKNK